MNVYMRTSSIKITCGRDHMIPPWECGNLLNIEGGGVRLLTLLGPSYTTVMSYTELT